MTAKRKMKVLVIASVASMHDNFNRENINILLDMGCDVTVAANFHTEEDINSQEKIDGFVKEMRAKGVHTAQVGFTRKTGNPVRLAESARQVGKLLEQRFDMVHCHAPVCAVLTRLAYRKYRKEYGGRLVYTAHGFHFYKGAPLKNWLLYYPVEKWMSRYTDVLLTINKEDYRRARKKFYARKVVYIPGVGVDTKKYAVCQTNREEKRQELGINNGSFALLSVGELQSRKNHKVVIEALHILNNPRIIYLVAGRGELEGEYRRLIRSYGLEKNIKLLGFRSDIDELCKAVDCFIHPSVREGFGIAPMEAMASGLPLISADVNGIRDYAENGVTGICVNPVSENEVADAINTMFVDEEFRKRCGKYNAEKAMKYDIGKTNKIMKKLYQNILYGREKWI